MAARLPGASFLGVDLAERQVAEGRVRVERLGVRNIELRHDNLTNIGPQDGPFDFIICHGVYSWAPPSVREAIMRICDENLSRQGVAMVSYNVFPGRRLRQTMRDALTLSLPQRDSLPLKVAKARQWLAHFAEHTRAETTWGRIFRDEAELLGRMPDDYIAHEFLEECNDPCCFTQFVLSAAKHDLVYVGEAELVAMLPETTFPSGAKVLKRLAGEQFLEAQQNIDIFNGRTFRQSLLAHGDRQPFLNRDLSRSAIAQLHLTPRQDFKFREETNGRALFCAPTGANIETSDLSCRRALELLIARYPRSSTLDQLVSEIAGEGAPAREIARATVSEALFNLCLLGGLTPSTLPTQASPSLAGRPMACPFLRKDVTAGAQSSANLAHESFRIDPIAGIVLPLLDGRTGVNELISAIVRAQQSGRLSFWREEKTVRDPDAILSCAKAHLARSLRSLSEDAVLVAEAEA